MFVKYVGAILLVASVGVQANPPDSTSIIKCNKRYVMTGVRLPEGCSLEPMYQGVPVVANKDVFELDAGEGQTIGDWNPPDIPSKDFHFTVQAGNVQGDYQITSALDTEPVDFVVYDHPDNTSVLECEKNILMVKDSMTCTITANKKGKNIYAENIFNPGSNIPGLTFGNFAPDHPAKEFTFTVFSGGESGQSVLSDGVSGDNWDLTVINIPDATSQFLCSTKTILVDRHLACRIFPRTKGKEIFAEATNFYFSGGNEGTAVEPIAPELSNFWEVSVLMGPTQTGYFHLSDGVTGDPPELAVWDQPDVTSITKCEDMKEAPLNYPLKCDLIPKRDGEVIYSGPWPWEMSAVDFKGKSVGNFSAILPNKVVTDFTFEFTGNTTGKVYLNNGRSMDSLDLDIVPIEDPDETSTLACASAVVSGHTALCTIKVMKEKKSIYAHQEAFKLNASFIADEPNDNDVDALKDDNGSFGPLTPTQVGRVFTFNYTAPLGLGTASISDGVTTGSFQIRVEPTPSISPSPSASPSFSKSSGSVTTRVGIILAVVLFIGIATFCYFNRNSQDDDDMQYRAVADRGSANA